MKPILSRLAIGGLFAVLAVGTAYQYFQHQRLVRVHVQSTNAIASALGRLTTVVSVLEIDNSISAQQLASDVRKSITPLSLTLIAAEIDVAAMDADSFAGLCALIAGADQLFPTSQIGGVNAQVNRLLNTRLQAMQAEVRNESAARSLRLGDRHKCALQSAAGT